MTRSLGGEVALVTGGSSGIGRASALAFARKGAKVVVSDIDIEGGKETVTMIKELGGAAIFVGADVSKAAEVEGMVKTAAEVYGRLDYAHNNAGIAGIVTSTVDCTEENWDNVISVNLKGIWLCMKYEIRQMLKQGGGAIVNTSSTAGLVGSPLGLPAYVASKQGILGLTRSAALEYARVAIRINAVCPGFIDTPQLEQVTAVVPQHKERVVSMQPMGRVGTPDEVAEAVVWLCSDAASFVTGHAMVVDGGRLAQ